MDSSLHARLKFRSQHMRVKVSKQKDQLEENEADGPDGSDAAKPSAPRGALRYLKNDFSVPPFPL